MTNILILLYLLNFIILAIGALLAFGMFNLAVGSVKDKVISSYFKLRRS